MSPIVRALRPKQWLKNVLVFAAPGAAGVVHHARPLAHALVAFVSFCAVSSATYLANDVADIEADQRHPVKRNRPIAAGLVSKPQAITVAAILAVAGFVVAGLVSRQLLVVLAVYLATTTAYSAGLKRIAVVDLLIVATGFVLRAVAGAVVSNIGQSEWFLLYTCFGSLFIVAGKRYAELVQHDPSVRATLSSYSVSYLRLVLGAALACSMLAYCLWAFEKHASASAALPLYLVSIGPLVGGLLRYLLVLEAGQGAAPEDVFWRDRPLQVMGLLWAVVFGVAVYAG